MKIKKGMAVDWKVVNDLKAQVGEEVLSGLYTLFIADINNHLEACRTALEKGDLEDLAENAHRMKGGAGSLGCHRVKDLAAVLQDEAERQAADPVLRGMIRSLAGACEAARIEVAQIIDPPILEATG